MPTSSRTRAQARCSQSGFCCAGTTDDWIGDRPAGSSVSVETARSPNTVIATVRGIGVAVITSTCGVFSPDFWLSAARCSTPNRCCSSTTTSPRSANCTLSSSSACVPTTIPAAPLAASSIAVRRAAAFSEPVSRPTRVARSAPPSMPCLGQVAEHLGQRLVVLGREHLGRSQQDRLAAVVDHRQHRPQRDHGLAGADLALQQPVHRVRTGQVGEDLLADLRLTFGELERQPLVELVQQAALGPRPRYGVQRVGDRPALGQDRLHHQRFLEPEPLLRVADVLLGVRQMHLLQGLAQAEQLLLAQDQLRDRVVQLLVQAVQDDLRSLRSIVAVGNFAVAG